MINNYLSQNLQFLRKRKKLSQQALADALGLSRSNVASYENAKAEPRASKLVEISRFFQVGLDQLISRKLEETEPGRNDNSGRGLDQMLAEHREEVEKFARKSRQLRRLIDGLSAYHELKEESLGNNEDEDLSTLLRDYAYLLRIMGKLVDSNEELLAVLTRDPEVVVSK